SFLIFIACLAAWRGNIIWSGLAFILAVNFKLQSIVYLPIIGLLWLPYFLDPAKWKKLAIAIGLIIVLQLLILLPFLLEGDLDKMVKVVAGSVDHYPVISANAFNMWYWFIDGDPYGVTDRIEFLGITAKNWGLGSFFFSSFILLMPVLLLVIKEIKKGLASGKEEMLDIILIAGALVTMNFFFFCTQMHERYSHPAMIFACAYTIRNRKWGLLLLFFLAYFLNMEKVMQYLEWENYDTFIYNPRFVASLFFIFMVFMYKDLYKNYFALRR
ncbi:MAG TPA: hypothetical protein VEB42_13030, partial [Chitinophagaceae bacterium]|nr:hypothetical protein [Chitinophagaceae bacterium]